MNIILERPIIRALQGAIASFSSPLGWLFIQYLNDVDLVVDLGDHIGLYAYFLIGTLIAFSSFGFYVGSKEQQVAELALRDALTGLFNVRYFRERLKEEINSCIRFKRPLSLVIFDLDHFKRVNDTYGHSIGDDVLANVSNAATKVLRKHEVIARVGGEEFVALLPKCNVVDAKETAERLRQQIAQCITLLESGDSISVTVSLGVVEWFEGDDDKSLYARADAALYSAKTNGRNRVEVG